MLLKKMPLFIESEVAEYKKKVAKKEAYDLPLRWTHTQLVMMLAVDIISANIDSPISGTINAGKAASESTSTAALPTTSSPRRMPRASACAATKQSPECKSTICPGVRGGVYVVRAGTMPERKIIKNARAGRSQSTSTRGLYEELRETERTKLNLDKTPSANMATMTNNQAFRWAFRCCKSTTTTSGQDHLYWLASIIATTGGRANPRWLASLATWLATTSGRANPHGLATGHDWGGSNAQRVSTDQCAPCMHLYCMQTICIGEGAG